MAGMALALTLPGDRNNMIYASGTSIHPPEVISNAVVPRSSLYKSSATPIPSWLTALCSPDESERFGAIKEATGAISGMSIAELEGALAHIATNGNLSTLLFVATQTKAPIFYGLSSEQIEALKDLPGAFPNLPAYFGAVLPDKGFPELKKIYLARPDMGLPILRAMGTTQKLEAKHWLIQEAVRVKQAGGDAYPAMAGLSRCVGDIVLTGEELGQLLNLGLNREEMILLAKAPVVLNHDDLKALVSKGGQAVAFGLEQILRDPLANAEVLCSHISNLLDQGKLNAASGLLNSDKVRSITDTALLEKLTPLQERLTQLESSEKK